MTLSERRIRAANAARIFQEHGVSQKDVADAVGGSQGQVSRILAGNVQRRSRLFIEVCLYAERLEEGVTPDMVRHNDELVGALAEAWDGTATHSKTLAMVIRSLAALKPLAK